MKIFEVGKKYHVLTDSMETAIKIVNDEGCYDEDEYDINECKECNYKDETYQPIETMKNLFTEKEIKEIKKEVKEKDQIVYKISLKNFKTYYFDIYDWQEYPAVLLTFYEILNNPLILSEFEKDSIISIIN